MGGIVGWIASVIMGNNARQRSILIVVVSIVGGTLGGWLIGPLPGAGSINDGITVMSFVVSLIGAVLLLAILNLFRRGATS